MADIVYPYEVVVYGTNTYYESSDEGLVSKSDITGGSYSLLTRDAYHLKPIRAIKNSIKYGEGGIKTEHSNQYQTFEIEFVRFNNKDLDCSDMDVYESLMDIFNKKYRFLEITQYKRTFHADGELLKIVVPKAETSFYPNKVGLSITAEVVKNE